MKFSKNTFLKIVSVVVIIFGLLTIKEGGSVVFDVGSARLNSGNYVPFVVWFNFLSGFLYVTAGIGLWLKKNWAVKLSLFLVASILVTYLALFIHIIGGGLYEMRTVFAMGFRTIIWVITGFISLKVIGCKKGHCLNNQDAGV